MIPALRTALLAATALLALPSASAAADLDAKAASDANAFLASDAGPDVEVAAQGSADTSITSPPAVVVDSSSSEEASFTAAGTATGPSSKTARTAVVLAASGAAAAVGLFWLVDALLRSCAGLGLFSRIADPKILVNEARRRVHDVIETNPGITLKELSAAAGLGWGTTVYHVRRLEAASLIVSERHRQFRRFFKNGSGIANDTKTAFAELKNPTTQRLASEVAQRPGLMQRELCQALGIKPPVAHKHLSRLEAARLLTRQRDWRTVKYYATPRLRGLLEPSRALEVCA